MISPPVDAFFVSGSQGLCEGGSVMLSPINARFLTGMKRGSGCKDKGGFGWGKVVSSGLQELQILEVSHCLW